MDLLGGVMDFSTVDAAIRMTSSSRDIYFHTPSRSQTKYWLESFIMSVPSPFLINSFGSLLVITYLLI